MRVLFSAVVLALAVLALAGASGRGAGAAAPPRADVGIVAIDTDPSGNSGSSLGSRQACRQVQPGATFDVDITIDAIPPTSEPAQYGLAGLQFIVSYDSQRLTLAKADRNFILAADPDSSLFPSATGDPTELQAGPPRIVIFGNVDTSSADGAEQGTKGVGARLTFTVPSAASGLAEIAVLASQGPQQTKLIQTDNGLFSIGQLVPGAIAISPTTCAGVAPQPTTVPPPGTPTADNTPQAGTTPGASVTPGGDTTPGADATPSDATPSDSTPAAPPTQTAIAGATATAFAGGQNGDQDDDGGGIGWLAILIIVLAAVAAAGLAGLAFVIRRLRA